MIFGIILKIDNDVKVVYDVLREEYSVYLIFFESFSFIKGVFIIFIKMLKGLEFDEVIVFLVNNKIYYSDYDCSLLYIVCIWVMYKFKLIYICELI